VVTNSRRISSKQIAGAKEFEVDGKKYTVKEDINSIVLSGEEDVVSLIRKLSRHAQQLLWYKIL
jgi:murein endopeptidase